MAIVNHITNTIVVVGGGQAGAWASRTLRERSYSGRIVLVGAESHMPYERPPLSKTVLLGETAPESTHLLSASDMDRMSIDWMGGTSASGIDRATRRLRLDNGQAIHYDKLILCMGGSARQLPVESAHRNKVHVLRTLDDSVRLGESLKSGMRLTVIGGGWIGLEVAASARKKGVAVTIVEASSRLCERSVTSDISTLLAQLHARNGVDVLLGTSLSGLSWLDDGTAALELDSGRTLVSDVVVAGIGLVPNDSLAREAGLDCNGGIVVDSACRTSDPDVFAAGDVAVTPNSWSGRPTRLESWQNAQEQGIAAAESALGLQVHYDPLPWFWSHQYDWHIQIVGVPHTYDCTVQRGSPQEGSGIILYMHGGLLVAAVGINAVRDLRFAQRIIARRTPVDSELLRDPATPMAKI
jgi:3-phenylpropionate/trans-cinnamate dioxygenase ferredoxin reductase subunit